MKNIEIESYIESQSEIVSKRLKIIRELITKEFPDAEETISYGIPTVKKKKNIIHYAGYKNHVGIYPGPKVIEILKEELSNYKTNKGTIQFKNTDELPIDIIIKIIKMAGEINDSK